jgi:hypothetical protein
MDYNAEFKRESILNYPMQKFCYTLGIWLLTTSVYSGWNYKKGKNKLRD